MVAVIHAAHVETAARAMPLTGSAEEIAENIAEIAEILRGIVAIAACAIAAVEAARLTAAGVDLARIVAAALVRIAQNVEGGGNLLEGLFGGLVAGIAVRMILLGQLPVRGTDLVVGRATLYVQDLIQIVVHRPRTLRAGAMRVPSDDPRPRFSRQANVLAFN
jgi:hypothetical protein